MNSYMDAQCRHMIAMIDTFENACKMASTQDDGLTSKDEEKALKKITAAAERFKAELNKLSIK